MPLGMLLYTWSRCGTITYKGIPRDKYRAYYATPEDAVYLKLDDQTMWDVSATIGVPWVHIRAWSLWMHPEIVEEVVVARTQKREEERLVKVQLFMESMEALRVHGPEAWDQYLQAMSKAHQNLTLDTIADMGNARLLAASEDYPARWGMDVIPLKFVYDRKILHGDASEELAKQGIHCGAPPQLGAASVRLRRRIRRTRRG